MYNLTQAQNCSADFYGNYYKDWQTKVFAITLNIVIQICGSASSIGIIHYERTVSDNRRTLINKLVSLLSHIILLISVIFLSFNHFRIVLGPLPMSICQLQQFIQFNCTFQVMLCIDEISVLRYLYICVFKTVGKLNDNFFHFYFGVANTAVSLFLSASLTFIEPVDAALYSLCRGFKTHDTGPKFAKSYAGVFVASSLLLCVTLGILVSRRKKKIAARDQHDRGGVSVKDFSLVDTRTMISIASMLILVMVKFLLAEYELAKTPRSLEEGLDPILFHISSAVLPAMMVTVIPMVIYSRNSHLRNVVFEATVYKFNLRQF